MNNKHKTAHLTGVEKTEQVVNQATTGVIDRLEVATPVADEKTQANQNGVGHSELTMESRCCICGEELNWYGNNPDPVDDFEEGKCCDVCDKVLVIPFRQLQSMQDYSSPQEVTVPKLTYDKKSFDCGKQKIEARVDFTNGVYILFTSFYTPGVKPEALLMIDGFDASNKRKDSYDLGKFNLDSVEQCQSIVKRLISVAQRAFSLIEEKYYFFVFNLVARYAEVVSKESWIGNGKRDNNTKTKHIKMTKQDLLEAVDDHIDLGADLMVKKNGNDSYNLYAMCSNGFVQIQNAQKSGCSHGTENNAHKKVSGE